MTQTRRDQIQGFRESTKESRRLRAKARDLTLAKTGRVVETKNADYTATLADANKAINFIGASGKTFTIPANSSVSFPIGTLFLVIQGGVSNLSVSCSDTLKGGDTVAANTVAFIVKVAKTSWVMVNGTTS